MNPCFTLQAWVRRAGPFPLWGRGAGEHSCGGTGAGPWAWQWVKLVWGWKPQQAHLPGTCEMQIMGTIGALSPGPLWQKLDFREAQLLHLGHGETWFWGSPRCTNLPTRGSPGLWAGKGTQLTTPGSSSLTLSRTSSGEASPGEYSAPRFPPSLLSCLYLATLSWTPPPMERCWLCLGPPCPPSGTMPPPPCDHWGSPTTSRPRALTHPAVYPGTLALSPDS